MLRAADFREGAVIALALSVTLFVAVPSSLYQSGMGIDGFGFLNFIIWSLPLSLAVALMLALAGHRSAYAKNIALVIAITILIKGMILKTEVPVLDGDATFGQAFGLEGIASMFTLLLALAIGIGIVLWRGRSIAPIVALVALAVSAQPLIQRENWTLTRDDRKPDRKPLFSLSKVERNVIVILIDTFQSDVFAEIVEAEKLEAEFSGFTYFYNTLGHAPYTQISLIPIYSGETYTGGSIREHYERAVDDSIFSDFRGRGYHVSLAGHYYYGLCLADTCMYRWDMVKSSPLKNALSKYIETVELSYLRVVPVALQPALYNSGSGLLGKYLATPIDAATGSIAALDAFADEMTVDSEVPTFKFLHLMTTHSPIILDENCHDVGAQRLTRQNYRNQAACAVHGVIRFLNALRANGVYESSDIVLMADHGASLSGRAPNRKFLRKVQALSGRSGGRFSPLFAVKPAGASASRITLSDAPVQLMDLRPTLCAITGCELQLNGINAFEAPADRQRSVLVYGGDAHRFTAQNDRLPDDVATVVIGADPSAVAQALP